MYSTIYILAPLLNIAGSSVTEFAGSCFYVSEDTRSEADAKNACITMGGFLAHLSRQETFDYVTVPLPQYDEFWVGLIRRYSVSLHKTEYYWGNNASIASGQWMPGEPNESGECVRLTRKAGDGYHSTSPHPLLGDAPCHRNYAYICQAPYTSSRGLRSILGRREIINGASIHACPTRSFLARSKPHCAVACTLNDHCRYFNFNVGFLTCTMYEILYDCPTTILGNIEVTTMERRCTWPNLS